MWDIFISYAIEDKESIAKPLANTLREQGLSVWYDDFELQVGDSLTNKIDDGIAKSRFGLVILSRSFFSKDWPQRELQGLETCGISGDIILLPVWHNISKKEIQHYSPTLADKVALDTSKKSIDEITKEVLEKVAPTIPLQNHQTVQYSLEISSGSHTYFFPNITLYPHHDLQGRYYIDIRKDPISSDKYAAVCDDLAPDQNDTNTWHASLKIGEKTFQYDNFKPSPILNSGDSYCLDIRIYTDSYGYKEVMKACSVAAKHSD